MNPFLGVIFAISGGRRLISVWGPSYINLLLLPFPVIGESQAQSIQAQPVVALDPPHDAQLEELLLAAGGPAANVPLVAADDVSEALTAAVAAPAPPSSVPSRRGPGYRHAAVVRPRAVDGNLVDHAAGLVVRGRRC